MALSPEAQVARKALLSAVKLRTGLGDTEAEIILRRTAGRMAGYSHEQMIEWYPFPEEETDGDS